MSLPPDLTQLMRPRALRFSKAKLGELGYGYRYYVFGLRTLLAGHRIHPKQLIDWKGANTQAEISRHVPAQWKHDIFDILATSRTPDKNTYWNYLAKNQYERALDGEKQTLPKALLSIAAVHWALGKRSLDWQATDGSVYVLASLYWLPNYTKGHYDRLKSDIIKIYTKCGLRYAAHANKPYKTLEDMATGKTSTYYTAARLKRCMRPADLGPILMIDPAIDAPGAAEERFLA
jgi:hypothetical protein